jgi:hypothetical protein
MTKQRELILLRELQDKFGYVLLDMKKEKDKFEYCLNLRTGKGKTMRALRLVVPETSALAKSLAVKKPKLKKGQNA